MEGRVAEVAGQVRAAEIIAALSLATDLGTGVPLEHGRHRRQYVANTRWWPPFCATVDWLVALVLIIEIVVGVNLHQ